MMENGNGSPVGMLFGTGVSSYKDYRGLYPVIQTALSCGIRGFDTAPSYRTEEILGKCLNICMDEMGIERKELFVQTKVDAWQMMEDQEQIETYVRDAARRMGVEYLDCLLIHWPVPEYFDKTWKILEKLQRAGDVRYIGVCNVRMRQLKEFSGLAVQPQIIQIERNPLRICESERIFCWENGIILQAYSPLCKMHEAIKNSSLLAGIAKKYGRNIGQIVMRWHIDTGALPVFTTKREARVREYAALDGFSLTGDEIAAINSLNRDYKMYLESMACPGF